MVNSKVELASVPQLTVQKDRLINTIHETALFGAKGRWGAESTQTGVCRLALSDEDKKVRDWFVNETKALGCKVQFDELGNIFAVYPGKNSGPPVAIGSHLDTQPTGGRYDGILGVLSGLEVLRTMKDNNYVPKYPIAVIDWTNEEGARFPVPMMSSAVWAGSSSLEDTHRLESVVDVETTNVKNELERIGYHNKSLPCSHKDNPLAAHFELHIEQGPILEEENKRIGLVQGIQACKWLRVTLNGKAQHTGTTPLQSRSDPLLAASTIMVKANEIAHAQGGLASVGILELDPAVANVIPESVSFIVDIRHHTDNKLQTMFEDLETAISSAARNSGRNISTKIDILTDQPAYHFDQRAKECIEASSNDLFGPDASLKIMSGAGHDSGLTSRVCPTAMIFIPSRDGVSHNPEEYSTPEQVSDGFRTLLGAVLRYDQLREA